MNHPYLVALVLMLGVGTTVAWGAEGILFYASFDRWLVADVAAGGRAPIKRIGGRLENGRTRIPPTSAGLRRSMLAVVSGQSHSQPPRVLSQEIQAMFPIMTTGCLLSALSPAAGPEKVFEVDPNANPSREKAVEYLLSLSEQEMLTLVPEQSGIYFTECPNCETDSQDWGDWEWVPQKPHQLKCKGCGAVYPNPQYPDHEYISVVAPTGEHRYYYYQRPDGYRLFFQARADYLAAEYLAARGQDLAELYWTTQDPTYARRAALLLLRFAEVYPGYAYKFDYPFQQKVFVPYTQNRVEGVPPYRTSRWSWWAYRGLSREMLRAYDAVRFWPGMDELDDGKARKKIEQDLLGAMVGFVMGFEEPYGNMSPGMWCDFIHAGRVLNRPEWVGEALQRVGTFMDRSFLYDGHWQEPAPSYGGQVLGNLQTVQEALEGYVPPAHAPAELSVGLRKNREKLAAGLAALARSFYDLQFPNGGLPTINDTWAQSRYRPRQATQSRLMPGLGLAILGGGEGENQIYAWLNNTGGRGHKHRDALSLGLFAFDRELLRDLGYTHTAWRAWALSMMSHNTVVVNGLDSGIAAQLQENRMRCFATDGRGFHLAEAENDAAYPGLTRRFRRTLVLVGADSRDAYLIDLFQVVGGQQHDYLLHGSADEDSTARVTGAILTPFDGDLMNPGTSFELPKAESASVGPAGGYGFVRRLSAGKAEPAIGLDLRLRSQPDIGTRTHLRCPSGTTVYLGEAPRIRQAERNDQLLPQFWAPFFCARRQGEDLTSVFVAVHEPVNGEPKIQAVSATRSEAGVLVTVERGTLGRDYFALAWEGAGRISEDTPDGRFEFDGGWGLARMQGGRCVEAHLIEGRFLSLRDMRLEGQPGWQGEIRRVVREASEEARGYFEVAENIPPDPAGVALLLEFPDGTVRAYNLCRIEKLETGTRLYVAEDPGFAVTDQGIELTSFPQRVIEGQTVHYRLYGVVHLRAGGSGW